ncbi:unnamed protein product [Mytilus coruscus]|uniref:Uncharacterized protein n=1 Tax=Mytilus coruscus TaxID=42192 RepID=A0A6J8EQ02_MYTCO|nr:unnamed protein product [Mytilus coruscus]
MRELLATQIQPNDLYNRVTNHKHFKNRLSGDEMMTMHTLMTDGFSKLNITLIYKIVKFFDFIRPRTQTWGAVPLTNEIEIGDDVERIRFARQHLSQRIDCDMHDLEFQTFFDDVEQLCMRVDNHLRKSKDLGFQKDIENFKTYPIEACQEIEYIAALKGQDYVKDQIIYKRCKRSGKRSRSTSRAISGDTTAANKKAKQQHSETPANIPARIAPFTPGPYGCAPDISFLITSEENKHLSAFLNAFVISLPLAKMQQNDAKRHNEISEIIGGVLKIPERTYVGSIAEGLNVPGSDSDSIFFANYSRYSDRLDFLPLPEGEHPGYSKLLVLDLNRELLEYTHLKDGKRYLKNNVKESIIYPAAKMLCSNGLSIHGPAYTAVLNESHLKNIDPNDQICTDLDLVFCFKRNEWPSQASEWKTRRRVSNWPTRELVDQIIHAGYCLAAVGSKESNESEMQWRVSFNKAEQLIIESLNETQMHCILLLKLLKKESCLSDIAGKNITSYSMKTVMFWCLEEKSNNYWQSSNLLCCFCFCVSKLKSFVEKGFLPNYFIRERNQFAAKEFTSDIQTSTKQYLENFLEDPKAGISLLLPSYRKYANTQIYTLNIWGQNTVIMKWLNTQISMARTYHSKFWPTVLAFDDINNIHYVINRCHEVLDKLKTVRFIQPFIKKLQNYMGVLQYILVKEEKKTGKDKCNSDTRKKYLKYMRLSAPGDLTHSTLRIATCYLDDDVKKDCFTIIRKVTELDEHFFMQTHEERLRQTLYDDIEAFRHKQHSVHDITLYNRIISDTDRIHQDPYRVIDEFEKLKEKGHVLIGYEALNLAWKRCYFDVTFMLVELPVLPKPAAQELCIDHSQSYVSFHPFLYGLLLEFLWHEKYGSGNDKKDLVIEKMKNCVSKLPAEQQSRGLNFITYCYVLQTDYRSAAIYLIRSFKLNPVRQNVAYLHIKNISKLFRYR